MVGDHGWGPLLRTIVGAWVGCHGWGMGSGHLVMRYTITFSNVEILNVRTQKCEIC